MARYKDAVCRKCRRIGEKLFLKGERCYTPRCGVERRRRPPGESVPRRRRPSDWALQLREKQKTRFMYGVLERQFGRYFDMARERTGATGDNLMPVLESRLANVVYRLAFVDSRQQGRQLVNHGHFYVDGSRVDIPSYLVNPGDVITWKRGGENGSTPEFIQELTDGLPKRLVPSWLRLDVANLTGEVVTPPVPSEADGNIEVRLVVEFYSK
jgi:small subunit ribosomal protein S4